MGCLWYNYSMMSNRGATWNSHFFEEPFPGGPVLDTILPPHDFRAKPRELPKGGILGPESFIVDYFAVPGATAVLLNAEHPGMDPVLPGLRRICDVRKLDRPKADYPDYYRDFREDHLVHFARECGKIREERPSLSPVSLGEGIFRLTDYYLIIDATSPANELYMGLNQVLEATAARVLDRLRGSFHLAHYLGEALSEQFYRFHETQDGVKIMQIVNPEDFIRASARLLSQQMPYAGDVLARGYRLWGHKALTLGCLRSKTGFVYGVNTAQSIKVKSNRKSLPSNVIVPDQPTESFLGSHILPARDKSIFIVSYPR